MSEFVLKSYEFRREREVVWAELDALVTRVEKKGLGALRADELTRLPVLYRATISSLSVARSISLDQALLAYLEALTARAYCCVYGTRQHVMQEVKRFFLHGFPAAVRQFRWHILLATAFLVLGVLTGLMLTLQDSDRFYSFVSAEYAQDRGPSSTTAELRAVLYDDGGGFVESLVAFASFLFTHNARIGIMCFALGFMAGIPVFFLMFINGLTLGAFAALYAERGLTLDFWAWLLPHGVTELGAMVLCAGAGLALGQALLFPGRYERLQNLRRQGKVAALVVLGAVGLFFIAGLIEGIFRQSVQDVPTRLFAIALTTIFWAVYFTYRRRPGVT
jgi:uncharacterized membrane protein SpoIIM required for sporulation